MYLDDLALSPLLKLFPYYYFCFQFTFQNNMLIEASRYEDLIVVRPDIEWQFECAYQTGPFQS